MFMLLSIYRKLIHHTHASIAICQAALFGTDQNVMMLFGWKGVSVLGGK